MRDEVDRSYDSIELPRQFAEKHIVDQVRKTKPNPLYCEDCNEAIPKARRDLDMKITRCVDCQEMIGK